MSRLNVLAGALCLGGVAVLAAVFGPSALRAGPGPALFSGSLGLAGLLFCLAATGQTVGGRLDLHDCSGLGDMAVGVAILAGLTAVPTGVAGFGYAILVVAGGLSAVAFGVVGLAEKYGVV
ncbi:hypothetical protein ACFQL1_00810 [Halomicroarcula sp. GCM10025709]|uniref:hypothetical protein n=1 Tax=Haloarcula TaxID=2237 RepID=UPI0024C2C68B|nr:hypothetical protein [Halomicroarcula sp. YJ-61-S]